MIKYNKFDQKKNDRRHESYQFTNGQGKSKNRPHASSFHIWKNVVSQVYRNSHFPPSEPRALAVADRFREGNRLVRRPKYGIGAYLIEYACTRQLLVKLRLHVTEKDAYVFLLELFDYAFDAKYSGRIGIVDASAIQNHNIYWHRIFQFPNKQLLFKPSSGVKVQI